MPWWVLVIGVGHTHSNSTTTYISEQNLHANLLLHLLLLLLHFGNVVFMNQFIIHKPQPNSPSPKNFLNIVSIIELTENCYNSVIKKEVIQFCLFLLQVPQNPKTHFPLTNFCVPYSCTTNSSSSSDGGARAASTHSLSNN
jgi:hypothetical protein